MRYLLCIEADSNDADYVTKTTEITESELKEIMPMIEAIKAVKKKKNACSSHNYPTQECVHGDDSAENMYGDVDGYEAFNEFVPSSEYGIHTITSVEVYEFSKLTRYIGT